MPNMENKIVAHNRRLVQEQAVDRNETRPCNCTKFKYPIQESGYSCRTESVIYEATVNSENTTRSYIGLTEKEFKTRFYQHRHDFNQKEDSTELSKYIWELKRANKKYEIKWNILKTVPKLSNGQKMCRLCTTEALFIMKNKKEQLNKRN